MHEDSVNAKDTARSFDLYESADGNFRGTLEEVLSFEKETVDKACAKYLAASVKAVEGAEDTFETVDDGFRGTREAVIAHQVRYKYGGRFTIAWYHNNRMGTSKPINVVSSPPDAIDGRTCVRTTKNTRALPP